MVIWVLFEFWELIGALGRNVWTFIPNYIFYSHPYVYICVCTLCLLVCPLDTGRELDVQQDFQKSSGVFWGYFYLFFTCTFRMRLVPRAGTYETRYSRLCQVKFVEGLSRTYPFKFFKGCFPQILLGSFLNALSHIFSLAFIVKLDTSQL